MEYVNIFVPQYVLLLGWRAVYQNFVKSNKT